MLLFGVVVFVVGVRCVLSVDCCSLLLCDVCRLFAFGCCSVSFVVVVWLVFVFVFFSKKNMFVVCCCVLSLFDFVVCLLLSV